MVGYIQAEALAKRWDISMRQVQYLCKHGRIDGAVKFGNTWAIPEDAEKPTRTGKLKPGRKTESKPTSDSESNSTSEPNHEASSDPKGRDNS